MNTGGASFKSNNEYEENIYKALEWAGIEWKEGPDKNENVNVMESDYWSYKDELPMNGGSFDGIVGYQNMGDSFSFFNQYKPVSETHPKLTDDLRTGMGTPQKEKYAYDMSQI